LAAEQGGAVAIRANSASDICAIRKKVKLPIIGLHKVNYPGFDVYITPTIKEALDISNAGADMIAVDATDRPHPDGLCLEERINQIKLKTSKLVLADISNYQEAVLAEHAGADMISTTMSGYTDESPNLVGPDFELLQKIASTLKTPVICEGRIWNPDQAKYALELGAHAVVVGSVITRPQLITRYFVDKLDEAFKTHIVTTG